MPKVTPKVLPKVLPKVAPKVAPKTAPKENKGDFQVILKLNKEASRPSLQSYTLRDKVNRALGTIAVTSIEQSIRGNIVITTKKPYQQISY